jgi:hypothetical protein
MVSRPQATMVIVMDTMGRKGSMVMGIIPKQVANHPYFKTMLFPGHTIAYAVPDGFTEKDRKLFYSDNFTDQIPAVEMFVLEEVAVINGFLIQGNRFLDEFSHHANSIGGSKWKSLLKLSILPKEHLDLAIWGIQDWGDNYFHWVTEMLPRLWAMHKTNREVPVLLLEKVSRLPFVKQAMEFFKIPFTFLRLQQQQR